RCATNAFQAALHGFFGDLIPNIMECYLDDAIIFARTFPELLDRQERFFNRVRESGITLKPSKANIAYDELKCIGFSVGRYGIRITDDRVDAIRKFPPPTTIKQLRQFLGIVSYLRRHIPNCANLAKPLTKMLHGKPTTITMTEEALHAFKELKKVITTKPVLQGWNPEKTAWLVCDASNEAVGAALLQD